MSSSRTRVVCIKAIWFPAPYTGCNGLGSGLGSNVERGFDGMGILCVFCVYDTIGNRCFEKTSFPKIAGFIVNCLIIPMMYRGYFSVIYFSRLGRINESSLPAVDFDNLQVLNDGNPSLLEIHVN